MAEINETKRCRCADTTGQSRTVLMEIQEGVIILVCEHCELRLDIPQGDLFADVIQMRMTLAVDHEAATSWYELIIPEKAW